MSERKQAEGSRASAPDFNPNFSFEISTDVKPQAAWEFTGALKQAREKQSAGATTIDEKIQKRLNEKGARKQAKAAQRSKQKHVQKGADSDADDESDDESDAESDSSEDKPLPGELDDDSDDEEIIEDEEDASEDEEISDEEDDDAGVNTDEELFKDEDGEDGDADHNGSDLSSGKMEPPGNKKKQAGRDKNDSKLANAAANGSAKQKGGKDLVNTGNAKTKNRTKKVEVPEETDEDLSSEGNEEEEDEDEGGSDEDEGEEGMEKESPPARKRQKGQNGAAVAPHQDEAKNAKNFFADNKGRSSSNIKFEDLNLSRPLLKAVAALGYQEPTPIQAACVPLALAGRDICGSAVTGSGKTAAYALPILERLLFRGRRVQVTYVLILAPTRELAVQVHSMIEKLAQFTDITAALAVGGLSLQVQATVLKKGPEIVVATPGRLIDHVRNTQSVGLEDLVVLVLDEADRLLEMGFKDEIHEIIKMSPKKRQTMLFSATFSAEVSKLVALSLKSPVRLAVDPSFMAPEKLSQEIVRLKGAQAAMKEATLLALCSRNFHKGRTIIFTRTKHKAHRLKILFGLLNLPPAGELHGDMTQAARLESLEKFRVGKLAFLLATDVAARGLDIVGVETVINFDAPRTLETHLHRIGRTARAGAAGRAITLAEDADRKLLKEVVHKTKADLKARLVPQPAISAYQAKIEAAGPDVARIIQEEREERDLRKAEMQVTKAQNMIDHEDEIMARPARTWFQTQREKSELAKRSKLGDAEMNGDHDDDEEMGQGKNAMQASSKKDKADRKRDRKALRAAEEAAAKKANRSKLKTETDEHSKKIKSIKSKARELVQQGVPVNKAAKIAAVSVTGVKRKKKNKTKEPMAASDALFQGEGRSVGSSKPPFGKPARSIQEKNQLKRGGKSKNAFKSKKKFKRRK